MRWLPTARAVWPGRRARLVLGGLALAVALSLGVSLVRQARMGVVASAPAAELQPIDVSFQAADAAPSNAQTAQGSRDVRNSQGGGSQVLSRAQAVALVQRRYRARVVRSHLLESAAGRPVYEFRLLAAGIVWNVRIDAYTGAQIP